LFSFVAQQSATEALKNQAIIPKHLKTTIQWVQKNYSKYRTKIRKYDLMLVVIKGRRRKSHLNTAIAGSAGD